MSESRRPAVNPTRRSLTWLSGGGPLKGAGIVPDAQTVTVLFTDMVGSTALLARLGDEQFDDLRRAHVAVLHEALGAHSGTEVKSTGDGVVGSKCAEPPIPRPSQ